MSFASEVIKAQASFPDALSCLELLKLTVLGSAEGSLNVHDL